MRALILLAALPVSATAAPDSAAVPGPVAATDLRATVSGLRSARGQVLACVTARPTAFPDCAADPQAKAVIVSAAATVELDFGPLPPGTYAISLFHDENGNGKLDKAVLVPREGYGFSRNAPVRFGPPRFASAAFAVGTGPVHQFIRMRYIL